MDIFEFELRYVSYTGLNRICKLWRDENTIINMVHISSQGVPDRPIQEISPDELKILTKQTYTTYKQDYIDQYNTYTEIFTKEKFYLPLSEYIERLEYELKVIKEMGFNTYMLVVSDFTTWAKKNNIMVWPGRWSGAGSLLAYVTQITDVNPFAYDLLFERFLNPARISMPDFDIDFEDTLRGKVITYVTDKYGHNNVCAIGTYMRLATKAAFKDAARAIGIPFEKSNLISNLMGEIKSLNQIINQEDNVPEELLVMYNQDNYIKSAIDQWAQLEWNLRQLWVHACGIIISPDPVTTHTPTQNITKSWEKTRVSQYDGPTLEYIWLVKMDFLGLRNLSVIKNCIKILRAKYKQPDTISSTDTAGQYYLEDQALFEEFMQTMSFNPDMNNTHVFEQVFMTGDTTGIFQFEWDGIRRFLIDLKPNHINDLVAMGALYRPWPLEFIPTYIRRKHGEEPVEYMLPELTQILREVYKKDDIISDEKIKLEEDLWPIMNLTYGIAVYQEQLMFLVQKMAWFSLPEADLLRRWIGKKKIEIIEQLKIEFMERAQTFRWYKPETSKFIYEKMIEPAASYSFNKSHAVCYAHIAYQTWYLKARYPVEFYAALLRSVEDDTDKLAHFIDEVQAHNIVIHPPHINTAFNHIAAIQDHIVMGWYACKGIGFEVGEQIEWERRNHGPFISLEDFLQRCPRVANKRILESLIKSGAFDLWYDRNTLLANLPTLLERHTTAASMDMGLFGGMAETQELHFTVSKTTSIIERCQYDMEIFKNMISWHPLDGLYPYVRKFGFIDKAKKSVESTPFGWLVMIKKITRAKKKWFFVLVEDVTDSFEFFIKDLMDLKIYDFFVVSGYKSRNRSIDTMIKVQLEDIITQATISKKYDPKWTVAAVRVGRWASKIPLSQVQQSLWENTTDDTESQAIINDTNDHNEEIDNEDISQDTTLDNTVSCEREEGCDTPSTWNLQPITIPLPPSITDIKHLITTIRDHPGTDHHIIINTTEYHISAQGREKIQQFSAKS